MRTCLRCQKCGCRCPPQYQFALFRDDPVVEVLPGRVITARATVTLTPGLHAQVGERVLTDPNGQPLGQTPLGDPRRRRREDDLVVVRRRNEIARALAGPQGWPGFVEGSTGNERWSGDTASDMIYDPAARWQQGVMQLEPGKGYAFVDKLRQNEAFLVNERLGNLHAMLPLGGGGYRAWANAEHYTGEWRDAGSTPDYLTPSVVTALIPPPWDSITDIQEHHIYTHRGPPGTGFQTGDATWGPAGPYFLQYQYEGDPTRPNNQFIEPMVFRVSDGSGGMWRYYLNRRENFQGFRWCLHAVHFGVDGTVDGPGEIIDGEENPFLPGSNRAPRYLSADVLAPSVDPRYSWSGEWDGLLYLSDASLVSVSPDGQSIVVKFRRHRFEDGSEFFPKPDSDEEWIFGTITPTTVTLGGSGGGSGGGGGTGGGSGLVSWTIKRLTKQIDYTTLVELEDSTNMAIFHSGCTLILPPPFVLRGLDYVSRTLVIGLPDGTEDPSFAPLEVGQKLSVAVPGGRTGPTFTRELWNTGREEKYWDTLAVPTGTLRGALPRVPGGSFEIPRVGAQWEFVIPPEGQVDLPLPIAPIAGYARIVVYAHVSVREVGTRNELGAVLLDLTTSNVGGNVLDLPLSKGRSPNVVLRTYGTPRRPHVAVLRQLSYQVHTPQGV